LDSTFLVHFVSGRIDGFYADPKDDATGAATNLERGIASLFQFQTENDPILESDVTGDCSATYVTGTELVKF
jgi:hypothetical protein